jgi:hypothetical protein
MRQPDGSVILYGQSLSRTTIGDRKTNKVFPAMEWLAAMCTHIPNRANRWYVTTDITATSHGENGRRQATIMLSPALTVGHELCLLRIEILYICRG